MRHEWTTVGERNTDALDYYCQLIEPGPDVSAADIASLDLREYELRARFFITKRAMKRLSQFHASLGFDASLPADSVLPETTGMKVLLNVTTTSSTRNGRTRQFNNVEDATGPYKVLIDPQTTRVLGPDGEAELSF